MRTSDRERVVTELMRLGAEGYCTFEEIAATSRPGTVFARAVDLFRGFTSEEVDDLTHEARERHLAETYRRMAEEHRERRRAVHDLAAAGYSLALFSR